MIFESSTVSADNAPVWIKNNKINRIKVFMIAFIAFFHDNARAMLSCENLTVKVAGADKPILANASVSFKPRAMNAVIGPSGCGKTTLLKAMMRILPAEGKSFFMGSPVEKSEDLIGRVGFAPQFTCAHLRLTVRESLRGVLDLALADKSQKNGREEYILKITGLAEHADKFVSSLSGGQLRRLGLALELANDPPAMFCDEITTGLDPLSENNILDFLKSLCISEGKTFICIIHNLAKLDYFDLITVIYEGEVVFQGNLQELKSYFGLESALELYDTLNAKDITYWRNKWKENSAGAEASEKASLQDCQEVKHLGEEGGSHLDGTPCLSNSGHRRPGAFSQFTTLLKRRILLFFRDSGYMLLTMGITFGFPIVVVIFALGGLPQIESLSLARNMGFIDELKASLNMQISAAHASALVTGLILFQVVLLALMGANNSAREIAGERQIYEKERLLGLSPVAYALSKMVFTGALAILQGIWMCAFVKYVCKFPGDFLPQAAVLSAVCLTMTVICLAFSALFSTADKANLVSIYLVGFQLPLSGIVLALPEALKWVCRPFISTYWGWAGYMGSMKDSRLYDAFIQTQASPEFIPSAGVASAVLLAQCAVAAAFVLKGCFDKRWN